MIPYRTWRTSLLEAEAEIARLGRYNEQISHTYSELIATQNAEIIKLQQQLDECREQLVEQTKSFCTHCGKLFPKGKEGFAAFRDHIAECNAHPMHPMATRIKELETKLQNIHENTWGANECDTETVRWKLQMVHDTTAYKEEP